MLARHAVLAAAALAGISLTPTGPAARGEDAPKVDFNFAVRPILSDRCLVCHGPDERARKADLRLDKKESALGSGAVVPGKPADSELVRRILLPASDPEHMPPARTNLTLSAAEVDTLRRWVAEGAEFKPLWALIPPPRTVAPPAVKDQAWPSGPLDRFVLARLEREGLRPSTPASKEEWLRRATFDLTGLPPTPAETDAFLADRSDQAYSKAADRLLASPHFGERMALDWLDAARYADSFGYQADGDTNVWPWRDWVIRAFNENLSYDRFVTEQVAGDHIPNASRSQRLATAFCRLNRMTNEGGSIPEEWRNEYVSDRVHTFGTAFLGLTFECSRCHDHKYDPLTMRDYYALGAFFNNIDEWGTYDSAAFRPTPTLDLPTPEQEKDLAAKRKAVEAAEAALRKAERDREPAFREWLGRKDRAATVPGLVGRYRFDLRKGASIPNEVDPKSPGTSSEANPTVAGDRGLALQFTGDDPAEFKAAPPRVERGEPFTVAMRVWLERRYDQAIVFHREAGTDTGFHGLEATIESGRLRLALVRFWPGNALAVVSRRELPVRQWVNLALTYDGSGRASGARLYLDGSPLETEVERDGLTRNIQVGGGLVFGDRFRSPGLAGSRLGELSVFDRALTPVEVRQVSLGTPLADAIARDDEPASRAYYFEAVDPEVRRARQGLQAARRALFDAETAVNEIMTMTEMASPRPAYVLARGAYDAPRNRPVGRDTPAALPPFPKDSPRDRLGLARWLVDPDHPLTARVAVNRFWQTFFGRGIVPTTENFGQQGALPSHPELLDWLARQFIDTGWDVKRLCKTIVLSSTYRQRSAAPASVRERDPDNRLLTRGPSQRLPAEMLRDAALAASGLLVDRVGGPPVKPPQPAGLWRGQNAFLPEYVADTGPNAYRRSLYTFWRRTSPPPNMLAFDAPSREVCVVRRQTTTTPLQPLVLLNDPQFVEAAAALGERMLNEGGASTPDRVSFAFRLAATRRPDDREREVLGRLFDAQRATFRREPERAKALLTASRHKVSGSHDPADLAAAAVTAGVILNADAAVTTR